MSGSRSFPARHFYFVVSSLLCVHLCDLVSATGPIMPHPVSNALKQGLRLGKPANRKLFREVDSDLVASNTMISSIGLDDTESGSTGKIVYLRELKK